MRHLPAVAIVALGFWLDDAAAFPSYLTCDRPLIEGHVIMGKSAVSANERATSFEGKECGTGTFTPGEELTLSVSGGGTYKLEVSGGTITDSAATCDGTRYANLGTSTASYTLKTSSDSLVVEAWIGRGTGPTTADMPVAIYSKCSLSAAAAGPAPQPQPTPTAGPTATPAPAPAPTPAPTVSPTTAAPAPTTPTTAVDRSSIVSTSLCFESNCKFQISFRASPSVADHVEVTARYEGHTWVGIGVSPDGTMSGDARAVITTWRDRVESHVYQLTGRTASAVQSGWLRLAAVESVTREGGVSTVVMNWPFTDTCSEELAFCRTAPTTIIAAHGFTDELGQHPAQARIIIEGNAARIYKAELDWYLVLHIVCMSIAWLFCAPLGLAMARLRHLAYFSAFLTRTRFKGGRQYWYIVHRNGLFSAVMLTMIGGILAITHIHHHFVSAHSVVGICTMSLSIVQVIDGIFRPKVGARFRTSWQYLHRGLGLSVCILAVVAGCLGASLFHAKINRDYDLFSQADIDMPALVIGSPPPILASPPPTIAVSPSLSPPVQSPSVLPPPATRATLLKAIPDAAKAVERIVLEDPSAGATFIRLAWHDAGTYDSTTRKYGPRASMRFEPEASNPSNKGLQYARELLEPVKQALPSISYADLWQLAAVVGIEMMGGPRIPFRAGRVDASGPEESAPAGLLPGAHDTAEQLRRVFYRMGFEPDHLVALMGAHTLGRCHPQYSGFNGPWTSDPLSFDNQYYVSMLNNSFSYSGSQWDADGLMMLNADMALKTDPEFRVYADLFATNQAAFFRNFSSAFSKLGELGWTLLEPVSYSIPKLHSNETVVANATIKQEVELKTGMKLSWTFHEDGNVSATVTLGATVGWLALGVSQDGRMVHQTPSYTVVGTDEGVQKRRLMSQDAANVSLSAPLEEAQDLHAASFDRADGVSTLRFRTTLSWFTRFAHAEASNTVWFIWAHGTPNNQGEAFGYHNLNRGNAQVHSFGQAPSPITTVPPSIAPPPPASTQSLSIKSNLHLAWAHKSDATTTLTLRLDAHVQWLALAVSAAGKMIAPQPSRAVVGTVAGGVRKRTLQAQDPTSVSSSAPLDAVQDLTDSSLTHENGATVLTFTVTQSFLTQFSDEGTTVNFIYAHGEPNFLTGSFGYHGLQRRGAVQVLDFIPGGSGGGGSVIFPPPPPSPPRLPSSRAPVELTPRAGVRLLVTPLESSGVSVELVVQQQVPWLSVAVSHSGWMSEPEPSKAVVGDLVSSGVTSYDLKYQSPASPVQSVVRDNDMTWVNNTSLFFADGATTLRFRASVSWLSFYLDQGPIIWLLWGHGSTVLPLAFPSYHTGNRGAVSISRADLFPPPPPSSSPPPPVPAPVSGSPPAGSGCSGSDPITDYCEESLSYQVARCYVSTSSLTAPQFDDAASAYEHSKQLSTEFRIAWTVKGDYPDGEISIMMQARTTGWIGFGIMADTANGASASGNGMIRSDIYIGAVVDGVATVLDAWSPSVAAPLGDAQSGHADDVYNVGGTEDAVQGLTTIWFTRKLATNDTWDYDIRAGFSIPVIFAYSRKNIDSFTHYHGPTRDYNKVVFIPVPPQDDPTITIVGAIVGVVVVLVLCLFDRKRRNQLASMEATRINVLRKEIDASIGSAGTLAYGISLINAHDFLRHKRILPFEALRDLNLLKAFDSTTEARAFAQSNTVLFLSYQWLGWDDPDPSGVHFRCISAAVRNIMSRASASMEETWLWIDHR